MRIAATLLVSGLLIGSQTVRADDMVFFTIGSGELGGGYHTVARAICTEVNRASTGGLRCSPETTPGSLYNLAGLATGELELALVQSDWLRHAYNGTSIFEDDGAETALRLVEPLYVEAITVLTRRSQNITRFSDLAGKRVDIGHPSSGRRATAEHVMAVLGLDVDAFAETRQLRSGTALRELCAGNLDAAILTVGHPSLAIDRVLDDCDVGIVALRPDEIAALAGSDPAYVATRIPADAYDALHVPVPTAGVVASLVSRSDLPAPVALAVREAVGAVAASAPRHGMPAVGALDMTDTMDVPRFPEPAPE